MRMYVALALALAACGGGGDHASYPTFQACFDEHHGKEGFNSMQSITICVLDHPVNNMSLMFGTAAECVAYVGQNLLPGSATAAEIQAGCDDYIVQKDQ
jgi:hypothetical protein